MIKASILISVYNGERYVGETIASALRQTLEDLELVVVNDGSTDGTMSVLRSFSDLRLRLIDLPHQGRVPALNAGIKACAGEYIAILDADDLFVPDKLEKQLRFMKEHGLELAGTWAEIIDESGKTIGEMTYPPAASQAVRRYALMHNPFIHSSVVMRREMLLKAGSYRAYRYGVEDYELWTRLIYTHPIGNMPEPLVKYRRHAAQATRTVNMKMRANALRVRLLALARYASSLLG